MHITFNIVYIIFSYNIRAETENFKTELYNQVLHVLNFSKLSPLHLYMYASTEIMAQFAQLNMLAKFNSTVSKSHEIS